MKAITFFFAMFLATVASAQSDAISKYFQKYVDDERFTVVYVSGKMFDMVNKMELELDDEKAEAIKEVVQELKGIRILVSEENGQQFYEEALKTIDTKEYEPMMTVRSTDNENVQFLVKENGDNLSELLLLVGSEDEFVLISFVGNIDLEKVGELTKAYEDEGEVETPDNHRP